MSHEHGYWIGESLIVAVTVLIISAIVHQAFLTTYQYPGGYLIDATLAFIISLIALLCAKFYVRFLVFSFLGATVTLLIYYLVPSLAPTLIANNLYLKIGVLQWLIFGSAGGFIYGSHSIIEKVVDKELPLPEPSIAA